MFVRLFSAQSKWTVWAAPLWVLALAGLLFLPTEYRGGAEAPHSHALLQLLLDAQDGQLAHNHAQPAQHGDASAFSWLDPDVAKAGQPSPPDAGQQQNSAPTLSIIAFLMVLPALAPVSGRLPRVSRSARRLLGHTPAILSPPPRAGCMLAQA